MEPAPKPRGTAQRHNSINAEEKENPIRATAVIKTLTAVTMPVPSRLIILSLKMLEITVPPAIIIDTYPA
jgi:hypothetical protein